MTGRPTKTTKLVLAVRKRMGRDLTRDEAVRLASALRVRQMQQQRVYKPRMELWDDGESATITALFELPGLRANEVLLDVVDGRLVVQGERRPAPAVNTNRARVQASSGPSQIRELKYGTFRRVISIPAGCTTDDLEATLENGMLSVSWPRRPEEEEADNADDSSDSDDSPADSCTSPRFGGSILSHSSP